ncbi:hypothetical protein OHI65_06935 [Brucella sp. MAB-22]|uniref:hypothetical protein n=1 Tax=Brucella sp. MAB-22 TaxID=2986424 RepID=UPI002220C2B2|nr:hypothetical protein [Brucella sp. MAB-22]UYT54108.1 hypothetical protein OHI65_06935 [Brucella sp. MAB-22]
MMSQAEVAVKTGVMCESLEDQHTNEKGSATEPSAARELALEEAANRFDRIADIINRNLYHQQEKIKDAQYIAAEGSAAIRALSSSDHADAGKVVGDGWQRYPAAWMVRENDHDAWDFCRLKKAADDLTARGFEVVPLYALPTPPSSEVA